MNEDALMALTELLVKLAELEAERPCSLARLAKQSGRPMSGLLRELAALEEMGLVERDLEASTVRLSGEGRRFCADLPRN
ncbi:helix-turn-helix domain-containing protein [Pseudoduganella sp. UC29_106]|uniref:HVO_A0114 family putative DNA-binding protein n=1 Tax=Pseudoduganella sp. UC29_106 TaxID=3374553 RepID=UPI0037581042